MSRRGRHFGMFALVPPIAALLWLYLMLCTLRVGYRPAPARLPAAERPR